MRSWPTVDGQEITAAAFRRVYQQQMQAYRQSYGANVDERLLKQLGIDQRIVQQMVEEEAALAEAKRLGISASDAEVRERILALPAFQENGQFIGDQRYRQLLQMQNPPMRPDEFEEQVRRSIVTEKLQAALTGWITVSRQRTSKQEFKPPQREGQARGGVVPRRQIPRRARRDRRRGREVLRGPQGRVPHPEKRKIRYVTLDQEAIRAEGRP